MMSSISLKTFSLKKHVRREGGGLTTKRLGFGWRAHSETWTQEPSNRRGLIGGLETWREREREQRRKYAHRVVCRERRLGLLKAD